MIDYEEGSLFHTRLLNQLKDGYGQDTPVAQAIEDAYSEMNIEDWPCDESTDYVDEAYGEAYDICCSYLSAKTRTTSL